jgi:hypothetical protein
MATFARPRDPVDAFARALNANDADDLGELFTDDAESARRHVCPGLRHPS